MELISETVESSSWEAKTERLVNAMESLKKLSKMQWQGSGAKEFADWMSRAEEDPMVPSDANCWNALLYSAHIAGIVDKEYIRKANVGGKDGDLGPALARVIAKSPRGCVLKDFKKYPDIKADEKPRQSDFVSRVGDVAAKIPRGDVIVLHSKAFHVCLSLGKGKVLELDNQGKHKAKNPTYNPNFIMENKKRYDDVSRARTKANRKEASVEDKQSLEKLEKEYEEWKKKNSREEFISSRLDNEIREVNLMDLSYLNPAAFVNMDGIYWGPLPDVSEFS